MLNMFKVRKWAALLLASFLSVMFFWVGVVMFGFLWGLCFLGVGSMVSLLLGFFLLKNPFTEMIEGKGILALDFNSTGVIRPFIIGVQNGYIRGKLDKVSVDDVFDRSTVLQLANPVRNFRKAFVGVPLGEEELEKARGFVAVLAEECKRRKELFDEAVKSGDKVLVKNTKKAYDKVLGEFGSAEREFKRLKVAKPEVGVRIELDELTYNDARFALFHYPVIIWNSQIKSVLTKGLLSDLEKETFAEHTVLYLNKKMEELTSVVRDFGRYVVELTKPKGSFLGGNWMWIVLVVGLVILGLIFAPSIIKVLAGAAGAAGKAAGSATGGAAGGAVVPVGG